MTRRWKLALGTTAVAAVGIALGFVFADRSGFVDRLQYPLRYDALVREQAQRFDLDPALVAAVIYQESRFRPNARSDAGAIGLMQVLPDTGETIARWTGGKSFRVGDLYDPVVNVRYGSWFLHHLFEKYGDETRALAAYHAGETNVDGWIREGSGIAFADTRDYIRRVQDAKRAYRRAYGDRLSVAAE